MDPLPPFVDEHTARTRAIPERTWDALLRILQSDVARGGMFALAIGAHPRVRSGDWSGDLTGVTIPGFLVVDAHPPARLELRGHHRFSAYALVFSIDADTIRAQTYAMFPGLRGRAYRAIVIGTGAHRIVVRRLLHRVVESTVAAAAHDSPR